MGHAKQSGACIPAALVRSGTFEYDTYTSMVSPMYISAHDSLHPSASALLCRKKRCWDCLSAPAAAPPTAPKPKPDLDSTPAPILPLRTALILCRWCSQLSRTMASVSDRSEGRSWWWTGLTLLVRCATCELEDITWIARASCVNEGCLVTRPPLAYQYVLWKKCNDYLFIPQT